MEARLREIERDPDISVCMLCSEMDTLVDNSDQGVTEHAGFQLVFVNFLADELVQNVSW